MVGVGLLGIIMRGLSTRFTQLPVTGAGRYPASPRSVGLRGRRWSVHSDRLIILTKVDCARLHDSIREVTSKHRSCFWFLKFSAILLSKHFVSYYAPFYL